MNDDLELLPSRRIEIPTRFIQQAYEHAQATQERYITLLFVGEGLDMTCVGVSTRRRLGGPSPETIPAEEDSETGESAWSLQTLTHEVIFSVIKENGPIDTESIGNKLGIAGGAVSLRQRIRRVLIRLLERKKIIREGEPHRPFYRTSTAKSMPLRPATNRNIKRADITMEMVMEKLRAASGPISSREIGDLLGIARSDSSVRSKVSAHIRNLLAAGRLQAFGTGQGTRSYQLVPDHQVPDQPDAEEPLQAGETTE